MQSIEAGENVVIQFSIKAEDTTPVPTDDVLSLLIRASVAGKLIQEWRYLKGSPMPEGMETTGDGEFQVELKPKSTSGVNGIAVITVIPTFSDERFFDTGGQTDVVTIRDLLTIDKP
jgi:hypothetical protein